MWSAFSDWTTISFSVTGPLSSLPTKVIDTVEMLRNFGSAVLVSSSRCIFLLGFTALHIESKRSNFLIYVALWNLFGKRCQHSLPPWPPYRRNKWAKRPCGAFVVPKKQHFSQSWHFQADFFAWVGFLLSYAKAFNCFGVLTICTPYCDTRSLNPVWKVLSYSFVGFATLSLSKREVFVSCD